METTRKTRRNTGRGCLCETHAVRLIDRRPILSRTKRHSRTEAMSGMDEPGVLLPLKMATPGFMAADERRNEGETPGVAMLHDLSQRRRKISWTSRSLSSPTSSNRFPPLSFLKHSLRTFVKNFSALSSCASRN
jgi:hypothetical protein